MGKHFDPPLRHILYLAVVGTIYRGSTGGCSFCSFMAAHGGGYRY